MRKEFFGGFEHPIHSRLRGGRAEIVCPQRPYGLCEGLACVCKGLGKRIPSFWAFGVHAYVRHVWVRI